MDLGSERREKTQHLQNIVSRLAGRPGLRLVLACQEGSMLASYAKEKGVEAVVGKQGKLGDFFFRLRLNWRLRKSDEPWLLQCYDEKSFALAIQIASKKDHLNIIYSALLPEPVTNKRILENIHLVSAVIAGTKEIADVMTSCGFLPSSLFGIPDCIDAARYSEHRERNDGRVVFACSDSLDSGHGYDQLLQSLAYLYGYEKMPPWELRITSGGPMFEKLLERAHELHVESRIAIFGGFHGPDILRDCDIMIAPADYGEGSSLTIKEGWASGMPVLCSDIPAHREMVQNNLNGLLFQNKAPAELAEKMLLLATDPTLRVKLSAAGRESLKDYSCEAMLHKHMALYNKILGQEQRLDSLDI